MLNFHSEENLAMLWKQAVFICRYNSCSQSFSHVRLFLTPWTVASQAPLSTEFLKQEKKNRLPLPPAGDLPNPGIESVSLESLALEGRFFTTSITWEVLLWPMLWYKLDKAFPSDMVPNEWQYCPLPVGLWGLKMAEE